MHRRKKYVVYPPNYKPGDGFVMCNSKFQAWKTAVKFGVGASVDVQINIHPSRCKNWIYSKQTGLWGPLTLR